MRKATRAIMKTMRRMMNNAISAIYQGAGGLKSAFVSMLALSMVWNLAAIPMAEAMPRNHRAPKAVSVSADPAALQGSPIVVWGPQQVVKPVVGSYIAQFSLPSGAVAPYQITISNGASNGTMKVFSARIIINGTDVFTPVNFNTINPSPQVRTVSLQTDNTIEVLIVGPSFSYITITITANQASFGLSPVSGTQGQSLAVALTGQGTNWVSGQTTASFGGETTVNSLTVNSATSATAQVTISPTAALGPRTVTVTTGTEVVTAVDAFAVNATAVPGAASSNVTTLAGSAGNPGFLDGSGTSAQFNNLAGIAAGAGDAVYVADAGNHSIRRVASNGTVTTVAGDGLQGFFDGQGAEAEFDNPQGLTVDGLGNVYVADTGNHSIRKIATDGTVTTVAGDGTPGYVDANGGSARFNSPRGVAVDNVGRIYVADTGNQRVRRIDGNGNVTTVAGDGTAGTGDSPNARFNGLTGIAIDGQTIYIYLADTGNHRIRRLDAAGTVITLTGAGRGFKDGTGSEARFADPTGVAVDGAGHIIVADTTNSLVREVDPARALNGDPNAVFTLAGTGQRGLTNGAGNVARFNRPGGVAVLTGGTVVVADTFNQVLRKIQLPPVIAALNPNQGAAGTSVTITGNRFDERGTSVNTVRFTTASGTATATVTAATRTQLNVTAPAGTVTGAVTVQTQSGTSNGVTFTVGGGTPQPPVIADFNPKSGPVGTLVTLTGTNLRIGAADPMITFAGAGGTRIPSSVAFSSATEARATVPNSAVTGTIQLTTSAGTATTAQPFVVQPGQDYAVTLTPTSTTAVQGSTAAYTVSVTSAQTTFTQLVNLSVTGLPAGAMGTFNPAQITAGATATLNVKLSPSLSPTSYSFTVQGKAVIDSAELTRTANGSLTVMASGSTTLAGRVLSTENVPIPNATVSAPAPSGSDITATTDGAGNFLLIGLQAGPKRPIFIQPPPGSVYPAIKEPADVTAGQSNVVPYTFYLPAVEPLNTAINPTGPTDVTNAKVPNLKMTIPQGMRLRVLGSSADVTHVSLTPVPIDRTPAPLPSTVATAMVYSSQPGNACIVDSSNQCTTSGGRVPVIYPNLSGASPGARLPLWAFDHNTVDWYQYGMGTVSADGKTIVPDAGVGLKDFSWHFPGVTPDGNPGPNDSCPVNKGTATVDYSTGMKIEMMTDIAFGGARGGLSLTRTFTSDLANPVNGVNPLYRFGSGFKDNYDIRLTGTFQANGAGRVVWPEQVSGRLFSSDATLSGGGVTTFTTRATTGQLGDTVRRIDATTLEYRSTKGWIMRFEPHSSGQYYRLKQMIDRNGNTTTLTYSGDNLTQVTDAVGRSITFQYNAPNCPECVWKATDPLNRTTTYGYDSSKRLVQVTDPLNKSMSYSYTVSNLLASVTDRRGNVIKQLNYDSNRRVSSQTFADGGTERYIYTLSGTMVTGIAIIDALGRTMTKRFNAAGYVIEETDELGQQSKIEREIGTNLATNTTGPCGCPETTKTYNSFGMVTSIKDRLNQTESWQYRTFAGPSDYDPVLNQVTQYTDKLNRVTSYGYDTVAPNSLLPRGNLTTMTDARLKITTYTYDYTRGAVLIEAKDPLNNKRKYDYDASAFMKEETVNQNSDNALLYKIAYEYDIVGNLKKMTDGEGRIAEMSYDDLNRMLTVREPANPAPGNPTYTYAYDENGNQTSVKDVFNREWISVYDKKNRMESTTDPLQRVSRMQYDAEDQLIKAISPSGRVMRSTYDERGQRKTMTDGIGGVVTFTYDNRGNLKTLADQRGNTTNFEYDQLFRLTGQRDPLGRLTAYEYDAVNNVKAKVDRLGRRAEADYDALNRPQQVRYVDATVNYTYDDASRWTSVSDASGTIAWEYDEAYRLKKETTNLGIIQYGFNKANQRTQMTAADRSPVTYGYDAAGRLQTIIQGSEVFTSGYDTLSQRTSLQRPNGVTTTSEYDEVHRLKRLKHTNASSIVLEDLQYGFNPDDEISSMTSLASASLAPQSKTVSMADAANRITQFGTANLSFDTEGQTTSKADGSGTSLYQWDARGRLKQVTLPNAQVVSYGYDALGRRINRVAGSVTTTFQYDGADVVIDRVSDGSAFDYLNGLGIDDKLRQSGGTPGTLYYLQDHLGSTTALTGIGGGLLEQQQYEAFGTNAGSVRTRYGYTGRERDDLTGLMYYRMRWYDAQQGRFISEDPLGISAGNNLYEYVDNDAINNIDPMGLTGSQPKLRKPKWKGGRMPGEPRKGPRIGDDIPQCNSSMSCEQLSLNIGSLALSINVRTLYPLPDLGHADRVFLEQIALLECMKIYAEKTGRGECDPDDRDCRRYRRGKERGKGKVPDLQFPSFDFPEFQRNRVGPDVIPISGPRIPTLKDVLAPRMPMIMILPVPLRCAINPGFCRPQPQG